MSIELNTRIVRVQNVMTAPIDQEVVIFNLAKNNYVNLDEIGRRIWDLLDTPRNVGDLCRKLSEEFDAAPEQITADVLAFLNELQAENLIHVAKE
jgi:hypothetical protein